MLKQKNRTGIDVINYLMGMFKDRVVERGKSGFWTYEKWVSGKAVCWGSYECTLSFDGAWGSLYTSELNSSRLDYPFAFAEAPDEHVELHTGGYSCWKYVQSDGLGVPTETQTAVYKAARPTKPSSTATAYLHFYVVGRWR